MDSKATERSAKEVLRAYLENCKNADLPIFSSFKEAQTKTRATILILGAAPEGGELPKEWEDDIVWALEQGMHIVSGLHYSLKENEKFRHAAEKSKAVIWDVRSDVNLQEIPICSAKAYHIKKPIVLTVGTDAALGKMTVSYELYKAALQKGIKSCMIPTGQTCIMIEGWGYSIDALPADFMAGAVEKMILEKDAKEYETFFVEGQGSLYHPAFSNTTISLLHGAVPTHLVLVHRPQRKHSIGSSLVKLPSIPEAIAHYEAAILPRYRNARVVAVALNTAGMTDEEITNETRRIEKETGLPVGDAIRDPDFVRRALERIL